MSNDMIERVAKASFTYNWHTRSDGAGIHRTDDFHGKAIKKFELESEAMDECRRMNARAALKALREPTDEMLSKADAVFNHEDCWHREIWQAMIDAALDEKEE